MLHEFRQDPVSGDWVLFSTERAKKPHSVFVNKFYQAPADCPFEMERMAEQEAPVLVYSHGSVIGDLTGDWTTAVIPNKYPALKKGICGPIRSEGVFNLSEGAGFHELVVTRDHEKSFAQFTTEETAEVLRVYRARYLAIAQDGCGEYISIFHNHGRLAGASVYHHHSQIMSMPVVPPAIARHLENVRMYFEKTGERLHDVLLAWELKEAKRIVYENEQFVVLCPYTSRSVHSMKIFPKKPRPSFEESSDEELSLLADALNAALKKLSTALDDPDYTFFINTAPSRKENPLHHEQYQWHIEILPRTSIEAGLEFETNIKINTVDPDEAAELLRNAAI